MKNIFSADGRKIDFILLFILAGGAFIRFYNLGSMSLSNDELSALTRVRYSSFSEMIREGVYIDYHPAGVQAFLYYYVKLFGDDVFVFRLPFVLCSLVSIILIYRIGLKCFNRLTALLAAAAFAFLSMPVLISQLARMYSPGVMFCLPAFPASHRYHRF